MKKTLAVLAVIAILVLIINTPATYAQRGKKLSVRVGYLNPKDAKSGFSIGGSFGAAVDESIEIGFGFDLFRKNYNKTSPVATQEYASGLNETTMQREVEYNTTILPLMAELLIKMPASWNHAYFLRGALGYELLWNKEKNYELSVSESRFYSGFAWQLGGGFMFKLGRRSSLFIEALYSSAEVSRDRSETPQGLPVWDQVDLSGFGARIGVSMGLF